MKNLLGGEWLLAYIFASMVFCSTVTGTVAMTRQDPMLGILGLHMDLMAVLVALAFVFVRTHRTR